MRKRLWFSSFAVALVGPYGDALGRLGLLEREDDPERAHALFLAAARLDASSARSR